jgi:HSP20 family protein
MQGALVRWDPLAELTELRTRFDRMLEDLGDGHTREWSPAVDLIRENGHLVVRADVPGIKPEEISIEVDHGVLSLSGKHEETEEKTDERIVRRERRYGAFSRRIPLPEGVDPKKIKAVTRDGVLEVTIPLPKEPAQEPVSITPTAV